MEYFENYRGDYIFDIYLVLNGDSKEKGFSKMQELIPNRWLSDAIILRDKAMDRVVQARDYALTRATSLDYDYLLFLDADVIVSYEDIFNLLQRDLPLVSALVPTLKGDAAFPSFNAWDRNMINIDEDYIGLGVLDMYYSGFGCMLISREVFSRVDCIRCDRHGDNSLMKGEDFCFCDDVRKLGYGIYVDSDVQVKHKMTGGWIYDIS